jgi:formiminotetrahydrofolate cyclodeaminase
MMQLIDHNLKQFTEVLASDVPAPGGGSVAALNGALAAALVHMTGGLTLAKEKYKEFHGVMQEIRTGAAALQVKLLAAVDEDTEAYNKVAAVFSLPKETDEQKAVRSEAMQTALKGAAATPFETMKAAHECLKLADLAFGKTNTSCMSDYGTAVLCAMACVRAAWLNVKINISGLKDKEYKEKAEKEASCILMEAENLAESLYKKIEQQI